MSVKMSPIFHKPVHIHPEPAKDGKSIQMRLGQRNRVHPALDVRSILVPVDFSPESFHALKVAGKMAQLLGASLTLLHVDESVTFIDFSESHPLAMNKDQIIARRIVDLQKMLENMDIPSGQTKRIIVRQGRAHHEITEVARDSKADLIILATHGYKGLKHCLLGSTAEKVVHHAPCSVYVVRNHEPEVPSKL